MLKISEVVDWNGRKIKCVKGDCRICCFSKFDEVKRYCDAHVKFVDDCTNNLIKNGIMVAFIDVTEEKE